ncbi:MAG: putative DsbA family dithiol-disulfide isomerase [Alphaproteobacteria bacterium]|jgi:predicted DsbA family dithiol-disulfide isomerase
MRRNLPIEFFFDPVCPWCFIGKRRLEEALDMRPELKAQIRWRAYQLNPDLPEPGVAQEMYLTSKFGGQRRIEQLQENIRMVGRHAGIDFAFEKIERMPNTLNAHRLIHLAADSMRDDVVVEQLFNAFFVDGRDIGHMPTLIEIAKESGLDPCEVEDSLSCGHYTAQVRQEGARAGVLGVQGAPCFIFDKQYLLAGAQEPESFFPIFDLVSLPKEDGYL